VPNANNNIIYRPDTGELICRVVGNGSFITLQSGEALTQLDITVDLDTVLISADGSAYYTRQEFQQGRIIGRNYVVNNLPNPTTVNFESNVYTITNGVLQISLNYSGNYIIYLQAAGYENSEQQFYYNSGGGGGGGGGGGNMEQ
jgi:hypothetical protein